MRTRLQLALAIAVARLTTFAVRSLKLGAASVLPGSLARRIQPKTLSLLARQVSGGIVLVAGTNGKTTTALLLRDVLERAGKRVVHNAAGANLENGLATALVERANFLGQLRADAAILEVDENALPKVLPALRPRLVLALNLFRDQLDRYGEVDTIARRWRDALLPLPDTTAIVNGDDPALAHLGEQLAAAWGGDSPPETLCDRVRYFGLTEPEAMLDELPHATDSTDCPRCGHPLAYAGVYLSHLGDYACESCGFRRPTPELDSRDWPQILLGLYNRYNTAAAATAARSLTLDDATIRAAIAGFRAAFGRAEDLTADGVPVRILLSKNPVGTNETARAVADWAKGRDAPPATLLVLNDRAADGTDVSWIWDADFEPLVACGGTLVVSGDRAWDLALRLTYAQPDPAAGATVLVEPDLKAAIAAALGRTAPGETLHVLPTYTAMLDVREILTGRKIL